MYLYIYNYPYHILYHHNGFVATHALGHMTSTLCIVDYL